MRLPTPLYWANEGIAFLLELVALVCLAWWGWRGVEHMPLRMVLAVAAPVAAAVVWGLFASPKATYTLPRAGVLAVKALVFGAAATALWAVERPAWALVFGIAVVVNTGLAALAPR
ncbi:YrdB family protein [Streptomyces sp. NPDC048717]|uniref:YrdB family protein n=1 Tax=Streptomyces sp. NPDC048717 TaxID=3154928 RepID=UPI00341C9ADE